MRSIRVLLYLLIVLSVSLAQVSVPEASGSPVPLSTNSLSRQIVVFKQGYNADAREKAVVGMGATLVKHLSMTNATVVLVSPQSLKALRSHVGVLRVEVDAVATADARAVPAEEVLTWGVNMVDADRVWGEDGGTVVTGTNAGAGIKIAVLDTGIDLSHPDLAANIKGGHNAIRPKQAPDDDSGHGTHVAGIIAAADNSQGVIGVAPKASLYAVKVLDKKGQGFVSDIIEGLEWSVKSGMHIVNMSFSLPEDLQSLHEAVVSTRNAGIILIAAAGNKGPAADSVRYPARYAEVVAVSAIDRNGAIADFSSTGSQVEFCGPGVEVYSTLNRGRYGFMSGTSMAAPHVTGVAALVMASGTTSPDHVVQRLISGASDLGATGRDSSYGYGVVNAANSVGKK